MKIVIIAIGVLKRGPELELINNYQKQMSWPLQIVELPSNNKLSGKALKEFEAAKITAKIPKGSKIIAMDERGKSYSSQEFAKILSNEQLNGNKKICFIIGGADGLDKSILELCQSRIALGNMTWPHKLARAMLVEQIYRAEKITSSHPYHRE